MKKVIDKLILLQIKNFCSSKDTTKRLKRQAIDYAKVFGMERTLNIQ
jgi:hypothetical protein